MPTVGPHTLHASGRMFVELLITMADGSVHIVLLSSTAAWDCTSGMRHTRSHLSPGTYFYVFLENHRTMTLM